LSGARVPPAQIRASANFLLCYASFIAKRFCPATLRNLCLHVDMTRPAFVRPFLRIGMSFKSKTRSTDGSLRYPVAPPPRVSGSSFNQVLFLPSRLGLLRICPFAAHVDLYRINQHLVRPSFERTPRLVEIRSISVQGRPHRTRDVRASLVLALNDGCNGIQRRVLRCFCASSRDGLDRGTR